MRKNEKEKKFVISLKIYLIKRKILMQHINYFGQRNFRIISMKTCWKIKSLKLLKRLLKKRNKIERIYIGLTIEKGRNIKGEG